jgi:Ca-activated chloride channel family protein
MRWPAALVLVAAMATAGGAEGCGVALALTVDVSSSIDASEYRLQVDGMVAALSDPEIALALVGEQAAVAVIQWSGAGEQEVSVPWRRMRSEADVIAFASVAAGLERPWHRGKTAVGDAITFARAQFGAVPDCDRRVIDVSGDGMTNSGAVEAFEAAKAARAGITINGLAIDRIGRSVTEFYRRNVIAGPDAFVITATGYGDYARAIREKLLREVLKPAF